MARIVYALSGQGRGHTSRVMAVSDELRERGHEIRFCCGGTAEEILRERGEDVLHVPALRQVMRGNAVRLGATIAENWRTVVGAPAIVRRLQAAFEAWQPDLLITDFEAFSPHAARRAGVPVLSFNHQEVVTETTYPLPATCVFQAGVTRAAVRCIAPSDAAHVLLTSFFFPPLKNPSTTTLIPPIIRREVQTLTPSDGEHVLVYYNQTEGAGHVLDALRRTDASFVVYNFTPDAPERYPNVVFKRPSLEGFLEDLARSRAVICTAGFTLISEALYLGKPLLVVPNRGIFEQTINALFLERDGLGEAVHDRPLLADDVRGFLDRLPTYRARLRGRDACGNAAAVACIERLLARTGTPAAAAADRPAAPAASVLNTD